MANCITVYDGQMEKLAQQNKIELGSTAVKMQLIYLQIHVHNILLRFEKHIYIIC